MARPTIKDLAAAADLSVSTVNRVIGGHSNVREVTIEQVRRAAEKIGFYGLNAIEDRLKNRLSRYRFGFLLQDSSGDFYTGVGDELKRHASNYSNAIIETEIEYLKDLSPESVSESMRALGEKVDALAVVTAQHPLISQAIFDLREAGKPVFAMISGLSSSCGAPYIGLDNWKVGRTAAWLVSHVSKRDGEVAILVGNHRYRCQEMNESGFRSYFREMAPNVRLLEPQSTFESDAIARDVTERLLDRHPDVEAIYVAGGGLAGVIDSVGRKRDAGQVCVIGHDMSSAIKRGLVNGLLTASIAHDIDRLASSTIEAMIKSISEPVEGVKLDTVLPFYTVTKESL